MRKYKYIWIPIVLLIYLGIMAWYTYPARNPTLGYAQYYITIGITLVVIGGVSYFYKKKADREEKDNKLKK